MMQMKYLILSSLLTCILLGVAVSEIEVKTKSAPKTKAPKAKEPKSKMTACDVYSGVVNQMISYLVFPYPNQIVLKPEMLSTIFDPNVKLRVTPVGEFNGFKGVIEYFYGLTIQMGVTSAKATKLVCSGNIVALQANVNFGISYPGTPVYPGPWDLTMMGFFTFDEAKSLISSMDVSLLNFGAALDRPNTVNPSTGITFQMELVLQICGISVYGKVGPQVFNPAGGSCVNGPLRIWQNTQSMTDYDYCVAFLTGIPFGSYNRVNSNSVVCRSTHVLLSITDPVHHCPHVSPAGGGKCVDFSYRSFYNATY